MHVLITTGPTREYIDDVRFLSNASSGRMGYALAESAVRRNWRVTIVSGPVALPAPVGVEVRRVTSALEMLEVCLELLPQVDGVIAVAAVSDFRPASRQARKLHRGEGPFQLELVPNPDILAEIGRRKSRQWTVGFAVESSDLLAGARAKLAAKNCDAVVVNSPQAMESGDTTIQLVDRTGTVAFGFSGSKEAAAERITEWIEKSLIRTETTSGPQL
ncbi:MAG: phosphopantothenoylcysteine decarboxylase [Planctomycetes bacterium]|nr:phosphopantothenoylcysteine decarboxylase [Planctomycetota bacterium]